MKESQGEALPIRRFGMVLTRGIVMGEIRDNDNRKIRRKLHMRRCCACHGVLHIEPVALDCETGLRYWSDGKMDGSMFPVVRQFGVCPICRHAFSFGDLEILTRRPVGIKTMPAAFQPDSDAWRNLAFRFSGNPDAEQSVRIAWWQHLNDAWRSGHLRPRPEIDVAWRGAMDENLTRLIDLPGMAGTDKRLLLAEALRELGQFDRALSLLVEVPEKMRWIASLIGVHAASGNEALFGLEKVEGGWQPLPPIDPMKSIPEKAA